MTQSQLLKAPKEPILEPLLRQFRLRRVINHIPPQAKLLDVGCGTAAAFLRAMALVPPNERTEVLICKG